MRAARILNMLLVLQRRGKLTAAELSEAGPGRAFALPGDVRDYEAMERVVDGLIEKAEKTEEYVDHDKVKDRVPEEQEKISAAVGSMLPVMKTMNKASAFIDKNEDVKDALEETEGIFDEVNKLLKKLISMNCLNEICIKAKLYKKIYEISQQIEEEQGKVLTCREVGKDG